MPAPVVVFQTQSETEAAVVKALLAANGFEASLSSGGSESVFPLGMDGTGGIRLVVSAEEAEDATRIIASFRDDQQRTGGLSLAEEYDILEGILHHRFRDRGLLEHALTHRSRANEDITGGVTDNESMEFLGDAVLGFVMADMLFRTYPDRDEGQKSKMKAGLVSAATLSRQAVSLGLGQHLLLGRGEEKSGGRRKPTLLADTYEAIICALYLDGGVDAAREFIEREFGALVAEAGVAALPGDDYKSALQERVQANGRPLPDYIVAEESGPAHRRMFRIDVAVSGDVLASGEGRTKKEAEQDAARQALARLESA
jgi:ribonuclease III